MTVRIGYNSKTVDFPDEPWRRTPPDYPRRALRGASAAGIVETLTVRTDTELDIGFRNFQHANATHATFFRNFKQFQQWAWNGGTWTLALDSGDTVLTTITNSPAAGTSTLELTSATGVVVGRHYVLRNEFDVEVVKIATLVSLTAGLTEPLNFNYYAGDRFRAEHYWPARVVDDAPMLINHPPLWFDVDMRFMEDLNSL